MSRAYKARALTIELQEHMVFVEGFEPPTPSSQARCATKLRYTKIKFGSQGWVRTNAGGAKDRCATTTQPGNITGHIKKLFSKNYFLFIIAVCAQVGESYLVAGAGLEPTATGV